MNSFFCTQLLFFCFVFWNLNFLKQWVAEKHYPILVPNLNMVTGLWYTNIPNFGSLSWFWRCKEHPCPFRSWFWALEDTGGSWLGCGILLFIWIWSLVFDTQIFQIVALYLDYEGSKNIYVFQVLSWDFAGDWRFLNETWHHDLDLDIVVGLWYTHSPNFGSLS